MVKQFENHLISSIIFFTVFLSFTLSLRHVFAAYKDKGNGTIYDDERLFLWQKADDGILIKIEEAENYCRSLNLANQEWFLPQMEDLQTLIKNNYKPTILPLFSSRSSNYITSTVEEIIYWYRNRLIVFHLFFCKF